MKTSEQILAHLKDVIANIYRRPEMYAQTPSELELALFHYHMLLGFVSDLDGLGKAYGELCVEDYGSATGPDWMIEQHGLDPEKLARVITHWRKVDQSIGLSIP